ncbi:MAG TPA: hypothetical protein VFA26_11895, partial [Gemmataceae bacterium]|nr:hypothetical protein [Gemmataceae bacterium]
DPDAAPPGADAAPPGADAAPPGANAAPPGADAAPPGADAAPPGADAAPPGADAPGSPFVLCPWNLAEPLTWLAGVLQAQDEVRLERLWSLAGNDLGLLDRCTACFARRYPDAPAAAAFRKRLREARCRRLRRRGLTGAATAACLVLGLWTYDAWGRHRAEAFQRDHADQPAAALEQWRDYQAWHPTRHLLRASSEEVEEARLRELRRQAREKERDDRLAELRRRAADPDADPEAAWQQFQDFHADYPDVSVDGDLQALRSALQGRRDAQVARRARRAYDDLVAAEARASDLQALIDQADRFLRDFPGTPHEADVRRRRAACLARIDERGIEAARAYSARNPLNFQTRREHYQRYLDRHPNGAAGKEARDALAAIDAEWDRHDFRAVRDHFLTRPGDVAELTARCRTYLAVHPQGRFAASAAELLRWGERVTAPGEYRVVLREGNFDKSVARWFSRGPDLSVEVEVAGARHGPSNIVPNRYDPDWDYEFPRRIKWKLGDPVVIRVYDHDWGKHQVVEIASAPGDPLAIRLLSGEAWSGPHHLVFESDFALPELPKIE